MERLMDQARRGETESMGQLLQLYRNYLTILATTQLDRRLRRRMSPSDLVQEAMLAAHLRFREIPRRLANANSWPGFGRS